MNDEIIIASKNNNNNNRVFIIAMDFMNAGCLEKLINDKNNNENKFNEAWIKNMLLQTLKQLEILHSDGYIHSDLKPANILINNNNIIKIGDFGCAVKCHPNEYIYGDYRGTIKYFSPEKWGDQSEECKGYNHTSDIWALGLVVMECYLSFVYVSFLFCSIFTFFFYFSFYMLRFCFV